MYKQATALPFQPFDLVRYEHDRHVGMIDGINHFREVSIPDSRLSTQIHNLFSPILQFITDCARHVSRSQHSALIDCEQMIPQGRYDNPVVIPAPTQR